MNIRSRPIGLTNICGAQVLQMKQRPRIYYSESQKVLMWDR
jgi:hypothetical protein